MPGEENINPQTLSIFQTSDLNSGRFGSYDAGAQTERHPTAQDIPWGTFAELTSLGMAAPSYVTTELIGVEVEAFTGDPVKIASQIQSAGSIGAVAKRGKVICRIDIDNKPVVNHAVSVNLNAGKIGYVTSLLTGGVLTVDKRAARVSAVYDTHCEVELAGDAVIVATYHA